MMLPEHSGSHTLGRTPGPIPCKCCRDRSAERSSPREPKCVPAEPCWHYPSQPWHSQMCVFDSNCSNQE